MKLFLAGGGGGKQEEELFETFIKVRLLSFNDWSVIGKKRTGNPGRFKYLEKIKKYKMKNNLNNLEIFLDSGAFSAWSKGIEIDIDEYIKFIKDNKDYISHYAVLDDITDPETTKKNQLYMEGKGLHPVPCFHYGEPTEYLEYYLDKHDYIALGGMVPIPKDRLVNWLDYLWRDYLTDKEGRAAKKIHGFGLTTLSLMLRYPWYSIDSTSWVLAGRFGSVYIPIIKNGKYDYTKIPHKIVFSDKSPKQEEKGEHYKTLSWMQQKIIKNYLDEKGYTAEELGEEYKKRDELNIVYFLDLEKELSKKERIFEKKGNKGFSL